MEMEIQPWFSGVRWFSEKRKGPVYRIELRADWQDRYKSARVFDDRDDLVGEIVGRDALLSGGAVELPSGDSLEVQVTAKFVGDDVAASIEGREPIWREATPAEIADVALLVRRAAMLDLAAGALLLVIGLFAVGVPIAGTGNLLAGVLLGAFMGFGAWHFLGEGADLVKGRGSSVLRALEAERSPIGWIHGRMRAGRMSLVVHFLDGASRSFEVPRDRWAGVFALFGARAPDAVQGYSPEAAAKYASLRKGRGRRSR